MMSKKNFKECERQCSDNVQHYGLRKLGIGVASVLLSTTFGLGMAAAAHADTINTGDTVTNEGNATLSAMPVAASPSNVTTNTMDSVSETMPTTVSAAPSNTATNATQSAISVVPESPVEMSAVSSTAPASSSTVVNSNINLLSSAINNNEVTNESSINSATAGSGTNVTGSEADNAPTVNVWCL